MEVQQLLITAGLGCMGIILIILIHVCILQRCSNSGNHSTSVTVLIQSGQSCRCTSMTRDDLKKLPSFNYRTEDHSNDDSSMECAVCLEGFKIGEMCRLLPICNHSFHAQCIDSWLLNTPSCPVCRTCAISKNSSSEKQHPAV